MSLDEAFKLTYLKPELQITLPGKEARLVQLSNGLWFWESFNEVNPVDKHPDIKELLSLEFEVTKR